MDPDRGVRIDWRAMENSEPRLPESIWLDSAVAALTPSGSLLPAAARSARVAFISSLFFT